MTKEQLQKGKELEEKIRTLENWMSYWENAESVLEVVLKLPSIPGRKEAPGYDKIRFDCSNFDFKRIQAAALKVLRDKLIEVKIELDNL